MVNEEDKVNLSPELQMKIKEHGEICNFIHELYEKKNSDYGDSMHPLYEEYGLTAFMILFSTKINRIKSLMKKGNANYESLEDSLLDLANYSIIAVTEMRAEKTKQIDTAHISYDDFVNKNYNKGDDK